jgi:hypothetical protein
MSTLWEQLLDEASKHPFLAPPMVHLDLWAAAEKVIELNVVVEALTREFEKFRTEAEQEIGRLRMKVEVLQSHDEKRRS